MRVMNEQEARKFNGGAKIYKCKLCGYRSTSWSKTWSQVMCCTWSLMGKWAMNISNLYDIADFISILK